MMAGRGGITRRDVLRVTGTTSVGVVCGNFQDVTLPFQQVQDAVTIDRTLGEVVYLPPAVGATVSGTSTFDPDTSLTVRIQVEEEQEPVSLQVATTTVTANGDWSASFELTDLQLGTDVTILVLRDGAELASAPGVIDRLFAEISFTDQVAPEGGAGVIVDAARLEAGGFIAIYDELDPDRVLGVSEYLEPGLVYRTVEIPFEQNLVGERQLVAVAHLDTDLDQNFDFTGDTSADDPYTDGEQPVRETAIVTGPSPTPIPTPTPRPTATPTETGPDPPPSNPVADVAVGGAGGLLGVRAFRRITRQAEPDPGDTQTNRPPNAEILYTPTEPDPGRPVVFDGSTSVDPDPGDRIVNYRWTLEEREPMAPRFVHVFLREGEYDVALTVVDSNGAIGRQTETITVQTAEGELALDGINPDASGDDHANLTQEYLVFENVGDDLLELEGWTIHDGAEAEDRVTPGEHTFAFPEGFELAAGEMVTIHTGTEPVDGVPPGDSGDGRHLYWGKPVAVWNNEGDIIVVEDGDDHPVMAMEYERTGTGEYQIEKLDVEILEEWFPDVVVSEREDEPLVSVEFEGLRATVSSITDFLASATFQRGPWEFVRSWALVAVFFFVAWLSWAGTIESGLLRRSLEPIVPLLLLAAATSMLGIGVLWLFVSEATSSVLDVLS